MAVLVKSLLWEKLIAIPKVSLVSRQIYAQACTLIKATS